MPNPSLSQSFRLFFACTFALTCAPAFAETSSLPPPAAAQGASAALATPAPSAALSIVLSEVDGPVSIQRAGSLIEARKGARLSAGDTISTGTGWCEIHIDGRTHIVISPDTSIEITEALREQAARAESTRLSMASGQIRARIKKTRSTAVFEVSTPTAVATVRGTTLYLKQGIFSGQEGSELFVDESKHGGVQLANRKTGNSVIVNARGLARALADGTLEKPRTLNKEEREAYFKSWNPGAGPAQQFGIEELPLSSPSTSLAQDALESYKETLPADALIDRFIEQAVPTINDLPPAVLPGPGFGPAEEPGEEEEPREEPGEEEKPGEEPVEEEEPREEPNENPLLEQQERSMIREEIAGLLGDQDFDNADANLARIADAQTGKVFTDVHGYRVRTDQYIFQQNIEDQAVVSLLSLTARTGPYLTGVSAVYLQTLLNRALSVEDGALRDLPWNDWMRVVTSGQLTGADLQIPYEQFIVHEHYSGEGAPGLYPVGMTATFVSPLANQQAGALILIETYSIPEFINADQGNFWVQGLGIQSAIWADENNGIGALYGPLLTSAQFNGVEVPLFTRSGAQTAGFAEDPRIGELDTAAGFASFRDSAEHPAFFELTAAGEHTLTGFFIPINDAGQIIDAPGFQIHGLRDMVRPNPQVNGGDYNLEMLWAYGTGADGSFAEQWRIDTVITPEIFENYGLKKLDGTPDDDSVF